MQKIGDIIYVWPTEDKMIVWTNKAGELILINYPKRFF